MQVGEVPNVSWQEIGGLENVKQELQEVIMFVILLFCLHFFFLCSVLTAKSFLL